MSKKKVCLVEDQIDRLMTDTAKIAQGRDDDICPTVQEMYEKHVRLSETTERKETKRKSKKKKSIEDKIEDGITRKITNRISAWVDNLI